MKPLARSSHDKPCRGRNNKGETLVESIVSLLVLTILMLAVGTMIKTSLIITGSSISTAEAVQEGVINNAVLANYTGTEYSLRFSTPAVLPSATAISASHNVKLTTGAGVIAFEPAP